MKLLLLAGLLVFAVGCETNETNSVTERDNSAVNERDADGATMTPSDQSNEQADIDLVAEIRDKVMEIDDLSVNGQNIKIITNEGKVILRGPVASAAERDAIEKVATKIAGENKVSSHLEVEAD